MDQGRLTRSETDRMVAGVCGGVGKFFNVDSTLVRVGFVMATLLGGSGVLLYLAMWVIVPPASRVDTPGRDVVRDNVAEGRRFAEDTARTVGERFDRLRGAPRDHRDRPEQAPTPPPYGEEPPPRPESGHPPVP